MQSAEVERSHAIVHRVTCPRCGIFDVFQQYISGERAQPSLTPADRTALSHAFRKATDDGLAEDPLGYQTVRGLINQHPLPDPVDQADLLIDCIARRTSYGQTTPAENADAWAARVGLNGPEELRYMIIDLEPLIGQTGFGDLRKASPGNLHQGNVAFSLKLEGWKRAREIRQQRGPGNQAFVAMWFHADMRQVYDDGFVPALKATGHEPYRVDLAAHEGKVDDEIVAQIRRSKLVIVDATGNRPNAYFEAGFAMGLGIPVLWCCNESWAACIHPTAPNSASPLPHVVRKWTDALAFDTRQHPFIFWSDADDLEKKLTARIRARGLGLLGPVDEDATQEAGAEAMFNDSRGK